MSEMYYSRVTGNPINRSVSTSDECLDILQALPVSSFPVCKVTGSIGRTRVSLISWNTKYKVIFITVWNMTWKNETTYIYIHIYTHTHTYIYIYIYVTMFIVFIVLLI